jgi:hypothetical protein
MDKKQHSEENHQTFFKCFDSIVNSRCVNGVANFVNKIRKALRDILYCICYYCCSNQKHRVIFSLVMAFLLSVACYFVENQPYNFKEKKLIFYLLDSSGGSKNRADSNVCFINVSHDRQLIPIEDRDIEDGNTPITDRRKLLAFLQKLEQEKVAYQYVIMDIRFEKGDRTNVDDQLFNQIHQMRNVVFAHHHADQGSGIAPLADEVLRDKMGMSDYRKFGNSSSFSRYTYLQDQIPSMALKMYDELMGQATSIKQLRNLPIYFSRHHLCVNSPMLYISGNVVSCKGAGTKVDGKSNKLADFDVTNSVYQDLGDAYLNADIDWKADLDHKYIVIGDFENDVHSTYKGGVPGSYITWMAFKNLLEGHHILSWSFVLLTVIGYWLILYSQVFLSEVSYLEKYKDNKKAQWILSAMRWVGSTLLMILLTSIYYWCFKVRYNVTWPIIFISIVNIVVQNSKRYEKNTSTNVSAAVA